MKEENSQIETVVTNVENSGTKTFEKKAEKIYKRKDIITTAIIAFLIGAIITAGGFTISKTLRRGRGDRDFKQNGIQRNINQEDLNNRPNDNRGRMNRTEDIPNNNQNNNNQNPPSMPNNEQQPSNSNSAPNNNNQNSTSSKS